MKTTIITVAITLAVIAAAMRVPQTRALLLGA